MELKLLARMLWRRRRLLAGVFLAALAPFLLVLLCVQSEYVSSARVYIVKSPTTATLLGRLNLDSASVVGTAGLSESERETFPALAMTRPVLTKVIDWLHLTRERKLVQVLKMIPFVRPLMRLAGWRPGIRPMSFEELAIKSPFHILFPRPNIKAAMYGDTDIMEIQSRAESIEMAVAMANAAARAFYDETVAIKRSECENLRLALERQIPQALADYEAELEKLRQVRVQELMPDSSTELSNLMTYYYAVLENRDTNRLNLVKAKSQLASYEAQLAGTPQYRKSSEQINRNALLDDLKTSLRDLYLDLANTRTKYTEDHPQVVDIKNKIEEAKKLLEQETQKVFGSETVTLADLYEFIQEKIAPLYAEIAGYESEAQALAQFLEHYEKKLQDFPRREMNYTLANAKAQAAGTFYTSLLQLRDQAMAGEDVDISPVRIVESARIPARVEDYRRPKTSLLLAAGFGAALLATMLAAFFAEYLDETVRGQEDLERLGLAPLAEVPTGAADAPIARERFRLLRATLERILGAPRWSLVLATPDGGNAAGFTARGLAEAAANGERTVLLIDADFHEPGLHLAYGLPGERGLADALREALPPAEAALAAPGRQGLFVLPAGTVSGDAGRLADSAAMRRLIEQAREGFDVVLVATSDLRRSSDAVFLGALADGVLACAQSRRAAVPATAAALAALNRAGARVLGAALVLEAPGTGRPAPLGFLKRRFGAA